MIVSIIRVDDSLPLPRYQTDGATGFDFLTRNDTTIPPHSIGLVPGNIIVRVPEGYSLIVVPRSSLPRKKALICPHSIGVIDQDYCGPNDEIFIQVQNISDKPVTVLRGERIAQGLFVRTERVEWQEADSHTTENRGGFGSTDDQSISSSSNQNHTLHVLHERSVASSAD